MPSKKYPIINHIYPGPQTGSVGSRNFSAARSDSQALAELGFIVVEIDGMGTPWRSKKFHDAYYGRYGRQHAAGSGRRNEGTRSAISVDRYRSRRHLGTFRRRLRRRGAMFRYPDFFKVGISEAGNHDNRNYEDDWGEKWQGLLDGTTTTTTRRISSSRKI